MEMPGIMRRAVLRFGGTPPTGSQQGFANCGIPGPVDTSGGVLLDGTGSGGGWPGPPTQAFYNTISQTWLKLDLDAQSSGRKISAIAIAPDSAIGCCDLWFGGDGADTQRHRLSPGNPLVADLSEFRTVMVTPVRSMARDDTSQSGSTAIGLAAWLLNHRVWDIADMGQVRPGSEGAISIPAFSWPLRLEIYFDGARPERAFTRAPYAAEANFLLTGRASGISGADANSEESSLTLCTDGRSSFEVIAFLNHPRTGGADTVTVRVYGGDGYPSTDGNGDVPNQLAPTENLIAWDELDPGTLLLDPIQNGPGKFGLGDGGTFRPIRYSFRNINSHYTFVKVIVELPHAIDPGSATLASGVILVNAYD